MLRFIAADLRQRWIGACAILVLVALAVALGIVISLQERALRLGSARAAQPFDIAIGAPGSPTQLVLSTVFLQPAALPLLPVETLQNLKNDPRVTYAIPLGLGDFYRDQPIVGTSPDLVAALYPGISEGRIFEAEAEALIGADVNLMIGETITPMHGRLHEGGHHHDDVKLRIVGRLKPSGTVWDRAILVPIQQTWHSHSAEGEHGHEHFYAHARAHADARDSNHHDNAHHHDGLDWDFDEATSGVPIILVKPKTIGDAYRIRQDYRNATTLAVFPAEVLTKLYGVMGDVRGLLGGIAIGAQCLVAGCLIFIAVLYLESRRRQIAALRALGISRHVILWITWSEISGLLLGGVVLGYGLGYGVALVIARYLQATSGVVLPIEWQNEDLYGFLIYALGVAVIGLIPALIAWRQPPALELKQRM